jgi:hypothetical protein
MGEIKSNLAALSVQMVVMMEDVKKNRVSGYTVPSRSPSPRKGDKLGCYQEEVGSRLAEIWVYPVVLTSRVPHEHFSFSGFLPCLLPPYYPG